MNKKFYLAYGSNLDMEQMRYRCPDATPVGLAYLENYRLAFKGSKSGNYLTIEKAEGMKVPVIIWAVSGNDERRLDMYEGFPRFYYKEEIKNLKYYDFSTDEDDELDAFIYIMQTGRNKYGRPSLTYWETCQQGYRDFGLDVDYLDEALDYTMSKIK